MDNREDRMMFLEDVAKTLRHESRQLEDRLRNLERETQSNHARLLEIRRALKNLDFYMEVLTSSGD